jgi:DNA polymerase I-like protein with 3'-5' exonuclease and polymerase domains
VNLPEFLTNPDPNIYRSDNYVVLDFETTTVNKGLPIYPDNRIVLACWRLGPAHPRYVCNGDRVQVRWAGEYDLGDLIEDITAADFLCAHNAKFELGWLARCGLDLGSVLVYDTMLAEYVLGGNRWVWAQLSLANCGQRRLGEGKIDVISKMFKAGLCSTEIPETWLEEYCIQDVNLTHRLMQAQLELLVEREQLPIVYTRCLLTPVLTDIEANGMTLDADLIRIRLAETEKEYAIASEEMERVTGGINPNSPRQLADFLYGTMKFEERKKKQGMKWVPDQTPSGRAKTDADTIARLKCTTKKQTAFVALFRRTKELYNELTKYLRKFNDCVESDGGVLRAQFNQSSTQTHRLSSTGLDYSTQFQNFPRVYKPLFKASHDGWLVGEADGSQLEFRVAGHLGRDRAVIQDIMDGVDVHSVTADIIDCSRQDAKAHTFKPLYGGSSGTPEQRSYYAYFKEKYTGVALAQQRWIDEVLCNGSLRTEWGLRYYWPGTRMDASGYVTNTTSICNYPVQAFATAEIIPISLVFFWHRLRVRGIQCRILNTVHDSIIAEFPPEEIEDFHALSQQCLMDDVYRYLHDVYNIDLIVPLGCGVKVATHWSGPDAPKYVPEGLEHKDGEVTYSVSPDLVTTDS